MTRENLQTPSGEQGQLQNQRELDLTERDQDKAKESPPFRLITVDLGNIARMTLEEVSPQAASTLAALLTSKHLKDEGGEVFGDARELVNGLPERSNVVMIRAGFSKSDTVLVTVLNSIRTTVPDDVPEELQHLEKGPKLGEAIKQYNIANATYKRAREKRRFFFLPLPGKSITVKAEAEKAAHKAQQDYVEARALVIDEVSTKWTSRLESQLWACLPLEHFVSKTGDAPSPLPSSLELLTNELIEDMCEAIDQAVLVALDPMKSDNKFERIQMFQVGTEQNLKKIKPHLDALSSTLLREGETIETVTQTVSDDELMMTFIFLCPGFLSPRWYSNFDKAKIKESLGDRDAWPKMGFPSG